MMVSSRELRTGRGAARPSREARLRCYRPTGRAGRGLEAASSVIASTSFVGDASSMPDGGPPANRTRCFPVREIAPTVGHVSTVSSRSLQFLVTLASDSSEEDVDALLARVAESGGDVRVTPGRESTVVGVIGEPNLLATITLDDLDGIAAVTPVAQAHKLVARETSPDPTLIQVRGRSAQPSMTPRKS